MTRRRDVAQRRADNAERRRLRHRLPPQLRGGGSDYYDRAGHPIDVARWVVWNGQWRQRQILSTTVGAARVSTIWLGLDHGMGFAEREVFESAVIEPGRGIMIRDRYPTIEAARAGHAEIVAWLHTEATHGDVS